MCPLYSFSICFDFPQLLIFPQINKNSFCRRFKLLKFLSLMLITNMLSLPSEIPTRHYRPITTSFSLFFIHPLALSDPFPSLLLSLFPIDLSPSRVFIQSLFLPFAPPSSFISFPFVSLATKTSSLTSFPIASLYIIYPLPLSLPPIFSFSFSHRSTPSSHLPPPFPSLPFLIHLLSFPPPPYIHLTIQGTVSPFSSIWSLQLSDYLCALITYKGTTTFSLRFLLFSHHIRYLHSSYNNIMCLFQADISTLCFTPQFL